MDEKYIVRLYDQFDGWIDVTGPISKCAAETKWNELTGNGTQKTTYAYGQYYKIFPANTQMIWTPASLGR